MPCSRAIPWNAWAACGVLRIDGEVFVNGESLNSAPSGAGRLSHPYGADCADHFGDALEDPSFLAMLAALVNSGYWFFGD